MNEKRVFGNYFYERDKALAQLEPLMAGNYSMMEFCGMNEDHHSE